MLVDIIEKNLNRIENDLNEIEGLKNIDFIDIFPTSEKQKLQLENEMKNIANLEVKTERGNVYTLIKPLDTKYGKLKWIKIRYFDESRLNWEAAADFIVDDRNVLLNKVGKDKRFTYIKRDEWDAIEFKTNNTLVYFLNPLASEVYNKKTNKGEK